MSGIVDDLIDHLTYGPVSKRANAAKKFLAGQLFPRFEARLDTLKAKEVA